MENTAIDLRMSGYEVHTVADCCTSRTQEDRLLALEVIDRDISDLFKTVSKIDINETTLFYRECELLDVTYLLRRTLFLNY